jgi:hypothetical protein
VVEKLSTDILDGKIGFEEFYLHLFGEL